jgi:hypothetical protein
MTPKISRYINKTILVSIPTLFHDNKCRPFTLVGIDVPGLWLQADDLTARLLPESLEAYASTAPVVFVPFAHIAGILVPTKAPVTAPSPSAVGAAPAPAAAPEAAGAAGKAARPKKSAPPPASTNP